jgi:hypothetical protein
MLSGKIGAAHAAPEGAAWIFSCGLLEDFSIRYSMDQFAVCLKKVEFSKFGSPHPLDGLEHLIADRPTKAPDRKENHFDIPVRVLVMYAKDLLTYFGLDHEFLRELAAKGGFQLFTLFDLASGKLPLHSVSVRMMTLADQDTVAICYDAGGDEDGFLLSH